MPAPPQVKFSHVDRVVFPEVDITKGDLLHYYERVSRLLLPHLHDRPLTLERIPEGFGKGKQLFWQKNSPAYYPKFIKRFNMPTEEGKPVQYAIANDLASLLYLVNQNCVTFHTFLSRIGSLDHPDFIVFDLDAGEGTFADLMRIAKRLKKILDTSKTKSFVKTSGKTGLHVLVPARKNDDFETAREWAIEIAQEVVAALPKIATMERSIAARGGRAYVDVMQNSKGKHVVPPYVVRATALATISMPLDWDELTPGLKPQKFMIPAALKRLTKIKKDPLAPLL